MHQQVAAPQVKKGNFLDHLTKGLYDAVVQAQSLAENQHIEALHKYVNEDGTPKFIDMDINGEKVKAWYLKLTFEIIDGPYKGRLIWTNLNLRNKNPKAVEIATRNLASICRSVHHLTPLDDSEVLHNKPLKIKVTIREAQNGYDASNEIRGYFPATDAPPQVASNPASGGVTPPWANQEQKKDGNKPLPF